MSLSPASILPRRLLLGAGMALAAPGLARGQTRWQVASAYPEGNFHTRNLQAFLEQVTQDSEGRLQFRLHSDAALLGMTEIRRGVQTGQAQIGEILLSAYGQEDPLFELDAIPQLVAGFGQAERLAALARPLVEARFRRTGSTLLYTVPWPPSGIFSNVPVETVEALHGLRLRTYNAQTQRFATLVGATPLLVQAAELRQAFSSGLVDSMVTSAATGVDVAAWDFLRIFTQIGFSWTKNAVFLQTRALEALPEALRGVILRAAALAEKRGWEMARSEHRGREAVLAERGVQIRPATPVLRQGLARVSEVMVDEWIAKAGPEGQRLIDAFRIG